MKLETIQTVVEQKLLINLSSESREREYVYARSVYFKLCRELTPYGITSIGSSLGKHHASVLHSLKTFDQVITKLEPKLYETYKEIYVYLKNHKDMYEDTQNYILDSIFDINNAIFKMVVRVDQLEEKLEKYENERAETQEAGR